MTAALTRPSHILHSEKPQATSQKDSDNMTAKNWKAKENLQSPAHPPGGSTAWCTVTSIWVWVQTYGPVT